MDYSFDDLKRDWKLACMHFPLYVALWFGTTPDEKLVDPGFPRRFVPRAFDAVMRNAAQELLPTPALRAPKSPKQDLQIDLPMAAAVTPTEDVDIFGAMPADLPSCQHLLLETRAALSEMRRQRDAYKQALHTIQSVASNAVPLS